MTTKKSNKGKTATKPQPCSAFTVRASGMMPAVIFQVGVSPSAGTGRLLVAEAIRSYSAVWSTASNCSRISQRVIEELALEPNPQKKNGELRYAVDIHLPNKIRITVQEAGVMDTSLVKDQAECLIGMDVISQGDISISHKDNKTFFSFRAPSLGGIDYAEQIESNKPSLGSTTMVRRNQMCPCGSGKRYKNCCGKFT